MKSMKKVFVSVFVVFCVVFMLSPLYAEQAKAKKISPCAVELKKANERIAMLEQKIAEAEAKVAAAESRANLAEARSDVFKAALNQRSKDEEAARIAEDRRAQDAAESEKKILELEGILTDLEADAKSFAHEVRSWQGLPTLYGLPEDSKIWSKTKGDLNLYDYALSKLASEPEFYNRFVSRNSSRLEIVSILENWVENPRLARSKERDDPREDRD